MYPCGKGDFDYGGIFHRENTKLKTKSNSVYTDVERGGGAVVQSISVLLTSKSSRTSKRSNVMHLQWITSKKILTIKRNIAQTFLELRIFFALSKKQSKKTAISSGNFPFTNQLLVWFCHKYIILFVIFIYCAIRSLRVS